MDEKTASAKQIKKLEKEKINLKEVHDIKVTEMSETFNRKLKKEQIDSFKTCEERIEEEIKFQIESCKDQLDQIYEEAEKVYEGKQTEEKTDSLDNQQL